LNSE
jgi:thioredoxin domain-containing protein 5